MTAADEPGFDLHRKRATQIRDYRDESQDALGQVAANISSRQGQFINILTLISAIFFPLTFLTGYFGMNFGVITMDLNKVWLYVLLGIVLPAAGVVVTLVILRRLIARMGVPMLPSRPTVQAEPAGHARPPACPRDGQLSHHLPLPASHLNSSNTHSGGSRAARPRAWPRSARA
jgi:hypothetical protein